MNPQAENPDESGEPVLEGAQAFSPPPAPAQPTEFAQQAQPAEPNQPAGWYPAPGGQRYWDGAQWTEHTAPPVSAVAAAPMTSAEQQQMAMFAHLGQLLGLISGIGGFLVPLILMLTKGKESDFVRRASVESLNFWITGIIAATVSFVLIFVIIGIVLFPLVLITWFVLPIYAGIKSNEGVDYRYPFNIRLIS